MGNKVLADQSLRSAYATGDASSAVRDLVAAFGEVDAAAVVFFCSPGMDGARIGKGLAGEYPDAAVIGCTTAGEFTERTSATGGVSAVVLPTAVAGRTAAALADLGAGVDAGIAAAVADIQRRLDVDLRDADPTRYIGFVLVDGLHGDEERVNEMLGNLAPLMSFVGGSAGDDLQFAKTTVFCGDTSSDRGAALLVVDAAVPFTVVKSCSFEPSGRRFTITEADVPERTVWEFDGRPAAAAYAEAVGCSVEELPEKGFLAHPLGLMIDERPWIRSPQRIVDGRGIKFYCQILPGMEVDLMNGTDLIADTRTALEQAAAEVGGRPSGAVMFNCILRRLELDQKGLHGRFVEALGGIPAAGFHTYGESWLGHINQTLTAVVFGR